MTAASFYSLRSEKELNCENFNDIELIETYIKNHNVYKAISYNYRRIHN